LRERGPWPRAAPEVIGSGFLHSEFAIRIFAIPWPTKRYRIST